MFCSTWTPKFWDEEARTLRNSEGLSFFCSRDFFHKPETTEAPHHQMTQAWEQAPAGTGGCPCLLAPSCWGFPPRAHGPEQAHGLGFSSPVRFSLEMLAPPLMKLLQHFYKCLLSLWSVQQRYKTIFQKPLILLFFSCISHFQCLFWTLYMNLISVSVAISSNFSCLGFMNPLLYLKDYFKLETKIRNR